MARLPTSASRARSGQLVGVRGLAAVIVSGILAGLGFEDVQAIG